MRKGLRLLVFLFYSCSAMAAEQQLSGISYSGFIDIQGGQFATSIDLGANQAVLFGMPDDAAFYPYSMELIAPSGGPAQCSVEQLAGDEALLFLGVQANAVGMHCQTLEAGTYILKGLAQQDLRVPLVTHFPGTDKQLAFFVSRPIDNTYVDTPIIPTLFLVDGGQVNTAAEVRFTGYLNGELVYESTVMDDGVAPDYAMADGHYNAVFTPSVAGTYLFKAEILGLDASNSNFIATANAVVTVKDAPAYEFSKEYSVDLVDGDGDGLINTLQLSFPIAGDISSETGMMIVTRLRAGEEVIDYTARQVLPATDLILEFDGLAIGNSGYDGPLSIDDIFVVFDSGESLVIRDIANTDYYLKGSWERKDLIYLGNEEISAYDTNGDVLYEAIAVDFDIDSATTGLFSVSLSAYDNNGNWMGTFGSSQVSLNAGINRARVEVPGHKFIALKSDTSLTFKNLLVHPAVKNGTDTLWMKGLVATSQAFSCWEFSGCTGGPNDPPIAVDDAVETFEPSVLINIVANDSDPDGDVLYLNSVTSPSNGTAVKEGNSVRYTPNSGFTGTDTFEYEVWDLDASSHVAKGGISTAVVTVTVTTDPNHPPVAADDEYNVANDTNTQINILDNDSDEDIGDWLYISDVTQPSSGTITNYGTVVVYTPVSGFEGDVSFSYTVVDVDTETNTMKGGSATAIVLLHVGPLVNNPPVAQDDSYQIEPGSTAELPVLDNDSDPDGDPLYFIRYSFPSQGSISVAQNVLSYSANATASGSDSFTYTISDTKGGESQATVIITFAGSNKAPVTQNDNLTVVSGEQAIFDVLANDSDPDGDTLSIVSVSAPLHGSASQTGGLLTYQADAGYVGTDSFTYTVSDGVYEATAQVSVTVEAASNDAPVAANDSVTVVSGESIAISVLANDVDPEGAVLSVISFTQPASGSVTQDGNILTYQSVADFSGVDSFSYTISDGEWQATAEATVLVVDESNQAPVASNDQASVVSGESVSIDVLSNDSDTDSDAISLVSFSPPLSGSVSQSGNVLIYESLPGFVGVDSFTYTISDGQTSAAGQVSVTVTAPPNLAPVAMDDEATVTSGGIISISVLDNDTDPDGDLLAITSFTNPKHGSVSQNGSVLTYASLLGFVGTDVFSYTVSDGHDVATAVVSVTVKGDSGSTGTYTNNQAYNIPDNRGYGVQSPIYVDISGHKEGISVFATILHDRVADLRIQLVSPEGRRFNLPADQTGSGEAQWHITLPKNHDVGGEWQLEVSDQKQSVVGVLEKWGLRFE